MKRLLSARSLLLTGACLAWLSPAFAQEDSSPSDSAPAVEQEEEARQETVVVRGLFIPDEKRSTSEVAALIDEGDFSLQETAMLPLPSRVLPVSPRLKTSSFTSVVSMSATRPRFSTDHRCQALRHCAGSCR